jgi:hypothetical protein
MADATTIHPARRPEIERLLDDYSVKWEFEPALPLAEISEKRSFANQARVDQPIQADLVETYVEAKKQGDIFPAIVVHKDGKDFVNVDGNHRFAADTKLGATTIPAYKITAKAETVRVLMTLLNVIHGRALSEKEKLWHAFFLIDSGTPQEKAAQVLHLPLTRLRQAWGLEQANRRSRDLKLSQKAWTQLPQSIRKRIASVNTDAAFREVFKLTVSASLTGDEASRLVTEVNKLRSETAQLDLIKREAEAARGRIQTTVGGRIKREQSPKHALAMHLGAIANVKMDTIPALVTDEEGSRLAETCLAAAEKLVNLADKLTAQPAPVGA